MNLLSELLTLIEGPAKVHVNGKLSVLADLIVKEFGPELNDLPFANRCLIGQFAYLLQARTGISLNKGFQILLKQYIHLPKNVRRRMSVKGVTPQEIIDFYDGQRIQHDGKAYTMRCTFHTFHGVEELMQAIESGHPVIVAYNANSHFSNGTSDFEGHGQFSSKHVDGDYLPPREGGQNHSLMAVGVDRESEEVIFRDLRSIYLYKGYVKVPAKVVDRQIPMSFTFDVSLEEVKNG